MDLSKPLHMGPGVAEASEGFPALHSHWKQLSQLGFFVRWYIHYDDIHIRHGSFISLPVLYQTKARICTSACSTLLNFSIDDKVSQIKAELFEKYLFRKIKTIIDWGNLELGKYEL